MSAKLLSGGNPQIAKGDGPKPVASMAVKWNSPMYGTKDAGFFVSVHAFAKFLRLTWFDGTKLKPKPPGTSKVPKTRYLDLYEEEPLDSAQLTKWLKQASKLPGWKP